MFAPFYRWLESKVKHPNLTAMICVLVAALIVVLPAIFVAEQMIEEASRGAVIIKRMVDSGEWRRSFDAHPLISPCRQLDRSAVRSAGYSQCHYVMADWHRRCFR